MKIYVKNIKKSKHSRYEVIKAASFFASKLMTKRLADTLTLYINFDDDLGYAGLATWLDEPVRGKEFSIRLDPTHREPEFVSLAHEMVHVKQYARGELRDLLSIEDQIVWQGSRHKCSNDDDNYNSQPWEVEAYAKEWILFDEFIEGKLS
jgi:hypothetical protein